MSNVLVIFHVEMDLDFITQIFKIFNKTSHSHHPWSSWCHNNYEAQFKSLIKYMLIIGKSSVRRFVEHLADPAILSSIYVYSRVNVDPVYHLLLKFQRKLKTDVWLPRNSSFFR